MKRSSRDKQLGSALPLESATSQSGQTNHPSENETGLDVSHHTPHLSEGRGEVFFLDILFHRMSAMGMLRHLTCKDEAHRRLRILSRSSTFSRRALYRDYAAMANLFAFSSH